MLTSRERLLRAVRRQPTDRVPISTYELVGCNSHAFENNDPSYRRLMDAIRAHTDCVCMWEPGSTALLPKTDHLSDFLETTAAAIEMDVERRREGNATVTRRVLHTPRGDLTCVSRVMDGVQTVWTTEHWCKSPDDVDRLLSIPYEPVEYDFADLARIEHELGDRGIVMSSLFDPLGWAASLMDTERMLLWAMTENDHFIRTLERIHERVMRNLRNMLDARVVDLYRICGPEYATPPFMGPGQFARYVVPFVGEMIELIHARDSLARLHSHGRVGGMLEMIAETGADALDPCEAPPDGDVTLAEIKRRVGGRMCLFGNIQLKLLEAGTPGQVEACVRHCMDQAKPGGGYVIMPTASPINSPLSPRTETNYLRYIETALACGIYD